MAYDLDDDFWEIFAENSSEWGKDYDAFMKKPITGSPMLAYGGRAPAAPMPEMTAPMTPFNPQAPWATPYAPSNYARYFKNPFEGRMG